MGETRQHNIQNVTLFSLLSNIVLTIITWIAGVLGNSNAIIANAIESTNDIIASSVVFFGLKYSQKPANEDYPYGRGRIEPIITFIVVLIMILSAVFIVLGAIHNMNTPHALPKKWTLIFVTAFLVWKECCYRLVYKKSKQLNSSALLAEAWHHRSDALTSIATLAGISLALFLGAEYAYLDDVAAIVASIFIVYNAFKIFRPAWGEIMDKNSHEKFKLMIYEDAQLIPDIIQIEKCHVRKVGIYYYIDMHLEVDGKMPVRRGHAISHEFKDLLMDKHHEIGDVLIHIEPAVGT